MNLTSLIPASRASALALMLAASFAGWPMAAHADTDKATTEALESYFDFVDYNSGTITAAQIPADDWKKFYVLDVRDAKQFSEGHIPAAHNIEWRKVFGQRASLPRDKTILIYCNTGSFSGQAAMALRMAGFENVNILHGGYADWKAHGGMDAAARAARERK